MIEILEQKYYSSSELAERFKLSSGAVRKYFQSGRLQGVKIGRSWHCSESALLKFLNANKEKSS